MKLKVHELQTDYGGFRKGQCIYCRGRKYYVIAVPPGIISEGNVAIQAVHDESCFYEVPATDLERCSG